MTKPLTNKAAEKLVREPTILWERFKYSREKHPKNSEFDSSSFRFPYKNKHENKPHMALINILADETLGCIAKNTALQTQPFSTCKRFLRLHAPSLWEETEHVEAEMRMLGSLFLSTLFYVPAAILGNLRCVLDNTTTATWVAFSLGMSILLGLAFRREREREVATVYMNALITCSKIKHDTNSTRKAEGDSS
jgi:hypothetical protein